MFGGKNSFYYDGTFKELIYTIGSELELKVFNINSSVVKDGYIVFTLEEFLEKFPYKVWDKALAFGNKCTIIDAVWDSSIDEVIYTIKLDTSKYTTTKLSNQLKPYKEETMAKVNKAVFDANAQCCDIMNHLIKEETMEVIIKINPLEINAARCIIPIPKGYEFAGVDDDNQQVVFEKIGCQYPKTYEECCEVLLLKPERTTYSVSGLEYKRHLIVNLQRLLICRDAYWKIYGERMGFGKPWSPSKSDSVYCIFRFKGEIVKDNFVFGDSLILEFPTEEMRDVFYENFKDLIEQCKELL